MRWLTFQLILRRRVFWRKRGVRVRRGFVFGDDFQLSVGELFDLHHFVAGAFERVNDFVELEVDGASIAILCVLNEEDDEKGDNRRGGIYDELPGVGEMEVGAGKPPEKDDQDGGGEGPFGADDQRGASSEGVKAAAIQGVIGCCHFVTSLGPRRKLQIPKDLIVAGTRKLASRFLRVPRLIGA